MSRFDLDITEMSEERLLAPKGEFLTKIEKAELKTGTSTKDPSNPVDWARLDLTLAIKDSNVLQELNVDKFSTFYSTMISTEKESGKISMTNNPELGALLAACDLKTAEASKLFSEAASDANPTTQHEYNVAYLKAVAGALPGYGLIATVAHSKHPTDSSKMVARVTKLVKAEV